MSSCIVQQADGSINVENRTTGSGTSPVSNIPGIDTNQSVPGIPGASDTAPPGLTPSEPSPNNPVTLQGLIQAIANRGIDIRLKD